MRGGDKMANIAETRGTELSWARIEALPLRQRVGEIDAKCFHQLLSQEEAGRLIREHVGLFIADHRQALQSTIQVGPNIALDTRGVRLVRNRQHEVGYLGWAQNGGLVINAIERTLGRSGCK